MNFAKAIQKALEEQKSKDSFRMWLNSRAEANAILLQQYRVAK